MGETLTTESDTLLLLTSSVGGSTKRARAQIERQHRNRRRQGDEQDATEGGAQTDMQFSSEHDIINYLASNNDTELEINTSHHAALVPRSNKGQDAQSYVPPINISSQSRSMNPITALQHGSSDPFNTTPIAIDATVNELMYSSREWYLRSKWSLGFVLGHLAYHSIVWMTDIKYVLCREATFYATLALAYNYAVRIGRTAGSIRPPQGAHYKILAMKAIREELGGKPNALTIQAILDLAAAEFFEGNVTQSSLHLQAVQTLLKDMGSLKKLNECTKDFVGMTDYVLSWTLLTKPRFSVEDWDPGPWSAQPTLPNNQLIANVGSQITELPSSFLTIALSDLKEILTIRHAFHTISDRRHIDRTLRWLHIRALNVYTRLLIYFLDHISQSDITVGTHPEISNQFFAVTCVSLKYCHSLILYTPSVTTKHFPPIQIYRLLRKTIDMEGGMSRQQPELFIWLCFVGALVEELAGAEDLFPESLLTRFRQAINDHGLQSNEAVKDLLTFFLFADSLEPYLHQFLVEP